MGLSWQQGPLSPGAIGQFLVRVPLPERLLYVERLRRRMPVRFCGTWIADSENVLLLFEPGRYPVAYFPETDSSSDILEASEHSTRHRDLGLTRWYTVRAGGKSAPRGAWQHIELPAYAGELQGRIAFSWPAMDAFYEEDERITGHAADSYHRIDIRQSSRSLVVRHGDRTIADSKRPVVLYESGFAPRWYVPRADIDEAALILVEHQTFCPYKGLCSCTMTSVTRAWRRGRIARRMPRSVASATLCRLSRTSFRSSSTERGFIWNRGRQSFRTAPIANLPSPRHPRGDKSIPRPNRTTAGAAGASWLDYYR